MREPTAQATLEEIEAQLRAYEGAAAALSRGKQFRLDGVVVGPEKLAEVCAMADLWRRAANGLARRHKREVEIAHGLRVPGLGHGRPFVGVTRRVL